MNWIRAQISMNSYSICVQKRKKKTSQSCRSWDIFFLSYVLKTMALFFCLNLDSFCFCILESHSAIFFLKKTTTQLFSLCLGMEAGKKDAFWRLTKKGKKASEAGKTGFLDSILPRDWALLFNGVSGFCTVTSEGCGFETQTERCLTRISTALRSDWIGSYLCVEA